LSDPAAAARELQRAAGEGARGAYVAPFTHDGRPLFMRASDSPHADHSPDYVTDLDTLAGSFDPTSRRQFLGDNARRLYGVGA
jgi:predicted TIM-barrel fold metal-dependent hydrolase